LAGALARDYDARLVLLHIAAPAEVVGDAIVVLGAYLLTMKSRHLKKGRVEPSGVRAFERAGAPTCCTVQKHIL
jgi:hypothetical protein